ncbi:hypothetical protein HDG40_001323 [Paraburkholderia sp. JPY158]|uniref:Uncharacterized protein n=1 Tax=Paraburkholderia atlantica TaxID=2654982 RepID=A0A7W8Q3T7_PARAM|nr:hypothetical protein [Paraburkholderia atlantica]
MPSSTAARVACSGSSTRSFFSFDFGRAAHLDDCHAASELCHAFLQLLAIVVRCCLGDLRANLLHACLDVDLLACAIDNRGGLLADLDALGLAEFRESSLFERQAGFLGDHLAARQNRDVFEQCLATVAKTRRLHGYCLQDAANIVDDQRRERFAFHVCRDDQQRAS